MTKKPFGIEELNLVGDGGTPTVEGSGNIAIKLGSSTSASTTKLYIGDSANIATGEIANPYNTTVVNVGILTANKIFADNFSGSASGGDGPRYDDGLVLTEGQYLSWQSDALYPINRVRMTGLSDDSFVMEKDNMGTDETLRITPLGNLSIHNSSPPSPDSSAKIIQIDKGAFIEGQDKNSYVSIGANHYKYDSAGNRRFSYTGGWATELKLEDGEFSTRLSSSTATGGGTVTWLPRLNTTLNGANTCSTNNIAANAGATQIYEDSSTISSENYHLTLRKQSDSFGQAAGMGFCVTTADTNNPNVGASIIHQRLGSFSAGNLQFWTKSIPPGGSAGVLKRRMIIDHNGHVGVGTYDPLGVNATNSNTAWLAVGVVTAKQLYVNGSQVLGGATNDFTGTVTITNGNLEISNGNLIVDGGAIAATGDIYAFWSSSDKNLKDNIKPIEDPLAKVMSISGNTFNWNEKYRVEGVGEMAGMDDTGVIAQEIEALGLPGIVKEQYTGYKSVQYHKLIPLIIESIKELRLEQIIPSDRELKDNITPIPDPLDKIMKISGNTFNWNEKANQSTQADTGVIAQEVESLGLPQLVSEHTIYNEARTEGEKYKSVRYSQLIPLLIEAIKALKVEVDNLKNQN